MVGNVAEPLKLTGQEKPEKPRELALFQFGSCWVKGSEVPRTFGHGSKSQARSPNIRLNPTAKIVSRMGGEFTYQPKW